VRRCCWFLLLRWPSVDLKYLDCLAHSTLNRHPPTHPPALGAGACYHTAATRELSARFGDALPRVLDLEASLLHEVGARLAAAGGAVRAAAAAAAALDCLLSLAAAAAELRLARPALTRANVLRIRGGRHLLAEQVLDDGAFVPNDTDMEESAGRVVVVTGPNGSGKSVYARQVALIAFLAHVGSFVPAEEATVGLVDRIFTRVASHEAAAVPQSTFLIDLSQAAAMLRLATPRSLLILDEFGKGTAATDGAALVCAAAAALAAAPVAPRTLICTHFAEALDPALLPRAPQLAFRTMAVLVGGAAPGGGGGGGGDGDTEAAAAAAATAAAVAAGGGGDDDLTFLFRLVPGRAAPSFGLHCARRAGLDPAVIARAAAVLEAHARGAPAPRAPPLALAAKTAAFRALARRLLKLDAGDARAARALLAEAAAATAEA
jgi:DNA mismatch repair protein MSH5